MTDRALDLLVYGPAGVLLTAAGDMPAMAAKGRQRVGQELRNAHVVGRFVVDAGIRQLGGRLARPLAGSPSPDGTGDGSDAPSTHHGSPARRSPAPGAGSPVRDAAVDRAIPDYDTLSASQVVRRLDGLEPPELRAIVRHELANRGRRTVLHRAEQLLGGTPPAAP